MDDEFEFWLRRATSGQKLNALLRGQRIIMIAQELDFQMELKQMINYEKINKTVSGIKDVTVSIKTYFETLIPERDALKKERDELKALAATDDAFDQEKLDAVEAQLADVQNTLNALSAIAAGTPVVLPSAGGAADSSTG